MCVPNPAPLLKHFSILSVLISCFCRAESSFSRSSLCLFPAWLNGNLPKTFGFQLTSFAHFPPFCAPHCSVPTCSRCFWAQFSPGKAGGSGGSTKNPAVLSPRSWKGFTPHKGAPSLLSIPAPLNFPPWPSLPLHLPTKSYIIVWICSAL